MTVPYRLTMTSTLGHHVKHNLWKTRVKLPTSNGRDFKDVWRSTKGLLFDIRGHSVYLVGGYNYWRGRSKTWELTRNPHFYGLDEQDGPLLGYVADLSPMVCAA